MSTETCPQKKIFWSLTSWQIQQCLTWKHACYSCSRFPVCHINKETWWFPVCHINQIYSYCFQKVSYYNIIINNNNIHILNLPSQIYTHSKWWMFPLACAVLLRSCSNHFKHCEIWIEPVTNYCWKVYKYIEYDSILWWRSSILNNIHVIRGRVVPTVIKIYSAGLVISCFSIVQVSVWCSIICLMFCC